MKLKVPCRAGGLPTYAGTATAHLGTGDPRSWNSGPVEASRQSLRSPQLQTLPVRAGPCSAAATPFPYPLNPLVTGRSLLRWTFTCFAAVVKASDLIFVLFADRVISCLKAFVFWKVFWNAPKIIFMLSRLCSGRIKYSRYFTQ